MRKFLLLLKLFENVVIEFEDETFKGNYAIYTREDNIIKLYWKCIN